MKKFVILLAFILTVFSLSSAYADDIPSLTTSLISGGATEDEFLLNQTPWVNIILPDSETWSNTTFWTTAPSGSTYMYTNYTDQQNTWFDFNLINFIKGADNKFWNDIKSEGTWNINAIYSFDDGTFGKLSTTFKIVPEPISSALFLLGGAALFARRRKTQPKTTHSSH